MSWLLLTYILSFPIYLKLTQRTPKYIWKSRFDDKIKLTPVFVVPYLLIIPYLLLAVLYKIFTNDGLGLLLTLNIVQYSAILFWIFVPNGLLIWERVKQTPVNVLNKLINWVYKTDGNTNAFPSSHTYTSVILAFYMGVTFPQFYVYFWGFSSLIIYYQPFLQNSII